MYTSCEERGKTRHLARLSSKPSLKCRHLCFYYIINFYRLVAGGVIDITHIGRRGFESLLWSCDLRYCSIFSIHERNNEYAVQILSTHFYWNISMKQSNEYIHQYSNRNRKYINVHTGFFCFFYYYTTAVLEHLWQRKTSFPFPGFLQIRQREGFPKNDRILGVFNFTWSQRLK